MSGSKTKSGAQSNGPARVRIEINSGVLQVDGVDVILRPQSYAVLQTLVRNSGQLVSKKKLMAEVWGEAVVTDDSLTQCLVEIRRAIGDTEKTIIRTVPRRGFIYTGQLDHAAGRPEQISNPQIMRLALTIGLLAFLTVVAIVAPWRPDNTALDSKEQIAALAPPHNSIAVLPFLDLSDDQDLRFFGHALSEGVINALSSIPDLLVVSRTSSFSDELTGDDVRDISRRLNVRYVLEGSVRRSEAEIRIVVQLVDVISGQMAWSEHLTADIGQETEVQAAIAADVAATLDTGVPDDPAVGQSSDPATFSLYGHARQLINDRKAEQLPIAISLLQEALQRDPQFVRAMTELGRAYYQQRLAGQKSWTESTTASFRMIDRALEIAPDDPVANAALGWRELFHNRNYDAAAAHFSHAFAVAPRNAEVIQSAIPAWLTIGRIPDAIKLAEYLVRHDPLCYLCHRLLIMTYETAGLYDQAEQYILSLRSIYPDRSNINFQLTRILLLNGENQRARDVLENAASNEHDTWLGFKTILYHRIGEMEKHNQAAQELLARYRETEPSRIAIAYAGIGDFDAAFHWLQEHFRSARFFGMVHRDRFFLPMRDDPRWSDLIEQNTLSDEQFAKLEFPTNLPN